MRELPKIWEVTGRSTNHKQARNNKIKEAQSWRKKGRQKAKVQRGHVRTPLGFWATNVMMTTNMMRAVNMMSLFIVIRNIILNRSFLTE